MASRTSAGTSSRSGRLRSGFSDAFLVGAGFSLLGLIAAAVMISGRDSREHAEAARRGDVAPVAV